MLGWAPSFPSFQLSMRCAPFSKTNRKMMDEMANHSTRVRRYIDRYGLERVESYIDVCLSIDNLIDFYSPFIVRKRAAQNEEDGDDHKVFKMKSKDYMDPYINPPEYLEAQKQKIAEKLDRQRRFPEDPTRDVSGEPSWARSRPSVQSAHTYVAAKPQSAISCASPHLG